MRFLPLSGRLYSSTSIGLRKQRHESSPLEISAIKRD